MTNLSYTNAFLDIIMQPGYKITEKKQKKGESKMKKIVRSWLVVLVLAASVLVGGGVATQAAYDCPECCVSVETRDADPSGPPDELED